MDYFSYTARKLGNKSDRDSYTPLLQHIDTFKKDEVHLHKFVYEENKVSGIHLHGLMSIGRNIYRKKLCIKGFHVKMDKLNTKDDKFHWEHYMDKGQKLKPKRIV